MQLRSGDSLCILDHLNQLGNLQTLNLIDPVDRIDQIEIESDCLVELKKLCKLFRRQPTIGIVLLLVDVLL